MLKRLRNEAIIRIEDVNPSDKQLKVIGVFNAGATTYENKIILLLRVTESYVDPIKNNKYSIPVLKNQEINKREFDLNDSELDFSDSRVIKQNGKIISLTSLSHFRLAYSEDGIHFEIEDIPFITGNDQYESWGIEDPRITKIDDLYYITYSAVSEEGICVVLIKTIDFKETFGKSIILPPENKDVTIFPQKINGKYYILHRPVPNAIGRPNIWICESEDLRFFGNHQLLLTCDFSKGIARIGASANPILVDEYFLEIFHYADDQDFYMLGGILHDKNDPTKIRYISKSPLLKPEYDFELKGFFGGVVFSCGAILKDNLVYCYYGASDDSIGVACADKDELINFIKEGQ